MVFYKCDRLESLVVSAGVISIEDSAFVGCGRLGSITVSEDNSVFSSEDGVLFSKDSSELILYPVGRTDISYTVPDTVTVIGEYAFNGMSSLRDVVLPEGLLTIGKYAFNKCSSLDAVYIPDSVTRVGAFSGCISLSLLFIGGSLVSIGTTAFSGCSSLRSVTLGDSVTSIGMDAFMDCTVLSSVTFGGSLTSVGEYAFDGIVFLATDGVTALDVVPEGLRGSVFMGSDGVLVRQATVTFDANGGSGIMETVYADALHPIVPVCGFTAPYGTEFVGWSLSGTF